MLVQFLQRHISRDVFNLLTANEIPLTGPTGLRRFVAGIDIEAFCKLYFPEEFHLDFPPIHQRFLSDLSDIRQRAVDGKPGVRLVRAVPRGHAKSTFYARILPLHGFLFSWSPLTVLLGNTQVSARRLLKNIRELLETNEAIREDFGDLRGEVWQEERIESAEGTTIVCFGAGSGAIRGVSKPEARPSLIIGDDLDDDDSVRSPVQLAANKEWLDKSVMALGDQVRFTTSFVFVGTLIRKTSLLQHLIDSPDFDAIVEQGVKRFADNAELWAQWESWFLAQARDGRAPTDPATDAFYQEHRDELLAGTEVLWERPDAYYHLMRYRLSRGQAAFDSEVQNLPGAAGTRVNNVRLVASLPAETRGWRVYGALDSTIKGGKTNDLAAWVEAWLDPQNKQLYVAHVDAKQRSYQETIDVVMGRLKAQRFDGLWCESNAAGSLIIDLLQERIDASGLPYLPTPVYNRLPKEERIQTLSEYFGREQLFILDSTDPELIRELEGNSPFDDAADALATLVLQLRDLGLLDLLE
jgi:hypothetical protein